jgi:protein phosphatase 1G
VKAAYGVVQGNQLYVANAGDSRAVLCRGPDAIALSEDHKPASEVERNRITAAGGFISSVGGVIRLALGAAHTRLLKLLSIRSPCMVL